MSNQLKQERSLIDQTADNLVEWIIENDLEAGHRLPNERDLAEHLGVGRSTLREAVRMLSARNIVEVRHGAGCYICENTGIADDPLGLTFINDKAKLLENLIDFRLMIEPRIAQTAAYCATKEQIFELTALCDAVDDDLLNNRNNIENDILFHTKIAEASGNLLLPKLQPVICNAIQLYKNKMQYPSFCNEIMKTHRAVLHAIQNKDGAAAYDAMVLHLVYQRESMRTDSVSK